ncbi:MAG: helix-turn-helix transcriptional regulator [Alphaproteobacteria bacterium]|nr:helix-turn-helix transcriptional regulator [Alphaproteobacteria bacterium]
MISAEQIRGARGILNWTQDALAQECGLSPNTIYNLERGLSSRSAIVVRTTLEQKGIQFHGNTGVSIHRNLIVAYDGPGGSDKFYDDVLSAMKEGNEGIVAIFRSSDALARALGVMNEKDFGRLAALNRHGSIRCLLTSARASSPSIPFFQIREASQHLSPTISTLTYGGKHAVIISADDEHFSYHVAHSIGAARMDRNSFESLWLQSKPVVSSSKK